jgi:hypothetical protein
MKITILFCLPPRLRMSAGRLYPQFFLPRCLHKQALDEPCYFNKTTYSVYSVISTLSCNEPDDQTSKLVNTRESNFDKPTQFLDVPDFMIGYSKDVAKLSVPQVMKLGTLAPTLWLTDRRITAYSYQNDCFVVQYLPWSGSIILNIRHSASHRWFC